MLERVRFYPTYGQNNRRKFYKKISGLKSNGRKAHAEKYKIKVAAETSALCLVDDEKLSAIA